MCIASYSCSYLGDDNFHVLLSFIVLIVSSANGCPVFILNAKPTVGMDFRISGVHTQWQTQIKTQSSQLVGYLFWKPGVMQRHIAIRHCIATPLFLKADDGIFSKKPSSLQSNSSFHQRGKKCPPRIFHPLLLHLQQQIGAEFQFQGHLGQWMLSELSYRRHLVGLLLLDGEDKPSSGGPWSASGIIASNNSFWAVTKTTESVTTQSGGSMLFLGSNVNPPPGSPPGSGACSS
jgi:hypothetical protein